MTAKIKEILLLWLIICLLAGMSTAAHAMNSEMTFNLDGFTIDPSEPPQQWQTLQPQTENPFQQSFSQQVLPENSIQLDQGFTANTLFEGVRGGYILTWNTEADPYIAVLVNNVRVKNGDAIAGGQEVVVTANIPSGYSITHFECNSQYNYNGYPESYNTYTKDSETQYRFTAPTTLCSNVNLIISISKSFAIMVDNIAVTDGNKDDVLENGGTIRYFPDRSVLMLNNANVGSIEINTPLTLLFTGSNNHIRTIHSSAALTLSSYSSTDQLTVTAPASENSRAIYVEGASLTISNGANVYAQSSSGTTLSAGVDVAGYLEVSGKLTATGGNAAESYGIRCNSMAVKAASSVSGGEVTATGGDCYTGGNSTGVYVSGNAMVEYAATLTTVGQGASSTSRGMAAGGFSVRGKATMTSGNAWGESTALYCSGDIASWGNLSAKSGTASGGVSRGIAAAKLSVAGGSLDARASSGSAGSVGITASVTVSGGEVLSEGMSSAFSSAPVFSGGYQPVIRVSDLITAEVEADSTVAANYLKKYVFIRPRSLILTPSELTLRVGESQRISAAVPSGYSVQWFSSTPNVTVDQVTGTVTGVSAGTATITAKAYNPANAETDSAVCIVTVKGGSGAVTGIHFDQENVSLSTKYGLRTVKYWFSPLGTGGTELTWKCTDATGSIVRFEVSEEEQELYITSVGNGVAVISASTKNGISAYCRVTVSGIGGDTSIYIDYIDNSGVWYYDWSNTFTVRCTGKVSELLGVYIDGVYIPQLSTAGQRNYTVSDSEGKTLITFTREYMARLSHGTHTMTLSYSGYGTLSKTIYIQSVRDAPRTGDIPLTAFTSVSLLSLAAAACCLRKLKKKEHQ